MSDNSRRKKVRFNPVKSTRPVHVEIDGEQFNFDLEVMIRKFIKKVKKSGIMAKVQEHRFYEKPSVKERRKALNRKKIARKASEQNKNQKPDK